MTGHVDELMESLKRWYEEVNRHIFIGFLSYRGNVMPSFQKQRDVISMDAPDVWTVCPAEYYSEQ